MNGHDREQLAAWVVTQRTITGKLSKERRQRLKAIGFRF